MRSNKNLFLICIFLCIYGVIFSDINLILCEPEIPASLPNKTPEASEILSKPFEYYIERFSSIFKVGAFQGSTMILYGAIFLAAFKAVEICYNAPWILGNFFYYWTPLGTADDATGYLWGFISQKGSAGLLKRSLEGLEYVYFSSVLYKYFVPGFIRKIFDPKIEVNKDFSKQNHPTTISESLRSNEIIPRPRSEEYVTMYNDREQLIDLKNDFRMFREEHVQKRILDLNYRTLEPIQKEIESLDYLENIGELPEDKFIEICGAEASYLPKKAKLIRINLEDQVVCLNRLNPNQLMPAYVAIFEVPKLSNGKFVRIEESVHLSLAWFSNKYPHLLTFFQRLASEERSFSISIIKDRHKIDVNKCFFLDKENKHCLLFDEIRYSILGDIELADDLLTQKLVKFETKLNSNVKVISETQDFECQTTFEEFNDSMLRSGYVEETKDSEITENMFQIVSANPLAAVSLLVGAVLVPHLADITQVAEALLGLSKLPICNEFYSAASQMSIEDLKNTYNFTQEIAEKVRNAFDYIQNKPLLDTNHSESSQYLNKQFLYGVGVTAVCALAIGTAIWYFGSSPATTPTEIMQPLMATKGSLDLDAIRKAALDLD